MMYKNEEKNQANNAYCLLDRIRSIDAQIESERVAHNKVKNALEDERQRLVAALYEEGFTPVYSVPSMQMSSVLTPGMAVGKGR